MSEMILPSSQDTFVALHSAQTCEELWTVLVVPHGIGSSSAWEEPFGLYARFHRTDADGAVITALLACSDHRWRNGTHRLIRQLAGSGLLGEADLDGLAACFLQPELTIAVPRRLFDDQAVIFIKPDQAATRNVARVDPLPLGDQQSDDVVFVQRQIWPPLRRWAATRQVRHDPIRWRDLLDLARSSPSRDGAALAAGVMDAADGIEPADRAEAVQQGLAWGSGTVRLAALPGFADLEGVEEAKRRAMADPAEKVRAWATRPIRLTDDPSPGPASHPQSASETDDGRRQLSLFDTPSTGEVDRTL